MLPWVIANPGATVAEVCQRFGYTGPELAHDLEVVFVCGLPGYGPGDLMVAYIEDDRVVVDTADYFAGAPRLTPTEALSLLAAGMAVVATGQASPALESGVDKLSRLLLPDGDDSLAVDLATEPEMVGALRSAAADHQVVAITYTSLASDETTHRQVEPWSVFTSLGNWYLVGYCRLAQGERSFRVDRIRDAHVLGEDFEPPADIPEPVARYTPSEDDVVATIELAAAAHWVLDYYPVKVVSEKRDRMTIEFSAADAEVTARLLLRLGPHARLLSGDDVRAARDTLAARLLARYRT